MTLPSYLSPTRCCHGRIQRLEEFPTPPTSHHPDSTRDTRSAFNTKKHKRISLSSLLTLPKRSPWWFVNRNLRPQYRRNRHTIHTFWIRHCFHPIERVTVAVDLHTDARCVRFFDTKVLLLRYAPPSESRKERILPVLGEWVQITERWGLDMSDLTILG